MGVDSTATRKSKHRALNSHLEIVFWVHNTSRLKEQTSTPSGLARNLGLLGLTATGICSMFGAAINIVPFMIQRNVPGIGPYVLEAYLFAMVPAIFAALAYGILGSAMPRAGGSYLYASRSLNPYLGFVASFAQWFGLSIAIGVVSYVLITFLREIAAAMDWTSVAAMLDTGFAKVGLALAFLWTFVYVNILGARAYERTLVPMMFLMFALAGVVIIAGFAFDHGDFQAALLESEGVVVPDQAASFDFTIFLTASAVLFSSFIGFDSIAQAGGEAKNPGRTLPLAIILAITIVGTFYFLFTAAVYHAVPWNFVAERSLQQDMSAPGLLSYLLPPWGAVVILTGAAIALINDLPAMLLAVSRLVFAWAEDGIFPRYLTRTNRHQTPHLAILLSGIMASIGILGCHFAGDFFIGIDILVTSMLVNFLLMSLSVYFLPLRNAPLAKRITMVKSRSVQRFIAVAGTILLLSFLAIHISKDLLADVAAWYFHSTIVWLMVMAVASLIFFRERARLKSRGVDLKQHFSQLPPN